MERGGPEREGNRILRTNFETISQSGDCCFDSVVGRKGEGLDDTEANLARRDSIADFLQKIKGSDW
jgi:hypothetical protein